MYFALDIDSYIHPFQRSKQPLTTFTFPHLIHENSDGNIKYVFNGVSCRFYSRSIFRALCFVYICVFVFAFWLEKFSGWTVLTVLLAFESLLLMSICIFVYKCRAFFFYHPEFRMNHGLFFSRRKFVAHTVCGSATLLSYTKNTIPNLNGQYFL